MILKKTTLNEVEQYEFIFGDQLGRSQEILQSGLSQEVVATICEQNLELRTFVPQLIEVRIEKPKIESHGDVPRKLSYFLRL